MQRPNQQQQPPQQQQAQPGHPSDQLQKLITAANAGQLSHEQLSQLRAFLSSQGGTAAMGLQPLAGNASGNSSSSSSNINMQMPGMPGGMQQQQQQQQSPPQQQQQMQQMTQSPAPQYQNLSQNQNNAGAASSSSSNSAPGNPDPRALIAQLQNRIGNIDTVLKRTDITDQDRSRLSQELENNKRSLAAFVNQVKVAAAAQHQMQSMQAAGQGNNINEMQMAQQRAMAQKAQQIQAQMQQQQQIPHQNQLNYQQQASNNGGLNLTLPPNIAPRSSPSMQAQQLPPQMQAPNHPQQQQQMSPMPQQPQQMAAQRQPPPQFQQQNNQNQQPPQAANTASPAMSGNSPPNVNLQLQNQQSNQAKRRQQAPHLQQQASSQGGGGGRATPQPSQQQQMQSQNQMQQQSMQQLPQQQQQQQQPPPPPSTVSATSTIPSAQPSFTIPDSLSMPATQPEAFPASRPTLSSGTATNPILSAPAVTAPPLANLPSTRAAGVSGPAQASAAGGSNVASGAATPQASTSATPSHGGPAPTLGQPGPLALKNAEGRPYNKRKLQELVASIDPNQQLEAQVEDLLLEVADDFIDNVTRFACRLAKHRRSDRLECRDLNLVLDKTYNMQIPGFGSDEVKSSGTNRRTHLPAYQARLAAIRNEKKGT